MIDVDRCEHDRTAARCEDCRFDAAREAGRLLAQAPESGPVEPPMKTRQRRGLAGPVDWLGDDSGGSGDSEPSGSEPAEPGEPSESDSGESGEAKPKPKSKQKKQGKSKSSG